ncbi:ATP-binding protein [Desulfuromonas carbonis]|nr:sensor histidine kinase, HAMP domain-containing [Desulfuromonas sp. DDH964]
MLKLGIRYRLFLAMLAATVVVVGCMYVIVQWSFNRGFLQYINTLEEERLESLAGELQQAYEREGGWDFLQRDPAAWLRLMVGTLPPGTVDSERLQRLERRLERRAERGQPPLPREGPPGLEQRFELRVLLLDGDRQPIFGPPAPPDLNLRPLRQGAQVIGYLGLLPRQGLADASQLRFVRQQRLGLVLIAGVMLLVSALLALPLAKRLVRPLKALAAATHRLAAGEYGTRVAVTSRDELGQLAADFNALALTLEKNEAARRQWVADISHELRTPLAILRGEIEALQDGVRQPGPATIGSLHSEVLHLGRLVDDLYQLSLSDLGALNYRKQKLDLRTLVETVVEGYRDAFGRKELSLVVTLPPGPVPLFADGERLYQLLGNLLENSLRYTDPGGRLAVNLSTAGARATLDLFDSAPGVASADLDKLFDRLYRGEGSRNRASGGAGLGLAICRNIAEAHGGSISARPSPFGGVWIQVELPRAGASA